MITSGHVSSRLFGAVKVSSLGILSADVMQRLAFFVPPNSGVISFALDLSSAEEWLSRCKLFVSMSSAGLLNASWLSLLRLRDLCQLDNRLIYDEDAHCATGGEVAQTKTNCASDRCMTASRFCSDGLKPQTAPDEEEQIERR